MIDQGVNIEVSGLSEAYGSNVAMRYTRTQTKLEAVRASLKRLVSFTGRNLSLFAARVAQVEHVGPTGGAKSCLSSVCKRTLV